MLLRYIGLQLVLLFFYFVSYGQNLIINPSAETAPVGNGWTQVSGNWTRGQETVNASNSEAPVDGSYHFFCDDGVNSVDEIYQDIDVSSNAVYIDGGRYEYSFSGWVRDWNGNDYSQLIVEYRDASSTVLDSYSTGYQGPTSWTQYTDTRIAPVNTRTIRIRIQSQFNSGNDNDGYADALSLTGRLINNGPRGPGGVGSIDGTSDLSLWLDANTIGQSNASNVVSWTDQSGYDNNAGTVSGNEPQFRTNVLNGYPVLRFTAANTDYMRINDAASLKPTTISVFVVGSYTSSTSDWSPYLIKTDTWSWTKGYGIGKDNNNSAQRAFINQYSSNYVVGAQTAGITEIMNLVYDKTDVEYYNNEVSQGTSSYTADIDNVTNYLYLGISPDGGGSGVQAPLDGDIAEAIIIKRNVNDAERILINNYLSAKYDVDLGSNKVYFQADVGQGNFDHEVAGIGRMDASNIHNDAQGTGIVRINNPTGLGNNEFLMWGHDNGDLNATETSDVPSLVVQRFDRVWRVSEVNTSGTAVDVGSVDISWDLLSLGSVTASDIRLLIDTDNDGSFADETPISGATSVGGSIYKFSGVSGLVNNRRFTIGTINNVQTPLPIELISFAAKVVSEEVVLDWQTATETNNDYFTIERSQDAQNWESIRQITGSGNSNKLLTYNVIDYSPFTGKSYYRLKQTDYDGKYSYSSIRKVQLALNTAIRIYPNPTQNVVTIEGIDAINQDIRIYNVIGAEVGQSIPRVQRQGDNFVIDLSSLPIGVYFIKVEGQSFKVFKK